MRRHGARSSSCGGGGLAGSLALVREERCEGIGSVGIINPLPLGGESGNRFTTYVKEVNVRGIN